ncbi:hypothetical protein KC342_g113 [Hortaea werneckii]|nr:hypothetical protein KC342_g113 [Hortaea werneckii]
MTLQRYDTTYHRPPPLHFHPARQNNRFIRKLLITNGSKLRPGDITIGFGDLGLAEIQLVGVPGDLCAVGVVAVAFLFGGGRWQGGTVGVLRGRMDVMNLALEARRIAVWHLSVVNLTNEFFCLVRFDWCLWKVAQTEVNFSHCFLDAVNQVTGNIRAFHIIESQALRFDLQGETDVKLLDETVGGDEGVFEGAVHPADTEPDFHTALPPSSVFLKKDDRSMVAELNITGELGGKAVQGLSINDTRHERPVTRHCPDLETLHATYIHDVKCATAASNSPDDIACVFETMRRRATQGRTLPSPCTRGKLDPLTPSINPPFFVLSLNAETQKILAKISTSSVIYLSSSHSIEDPMPLRALLLEPKSTLRRPVDYLAMDGLASSLAVQVRSVQLGVSRKTSNPKVHGDRPQPLSERRTAFHSATMIQQLRNFRDLYVRPSLGHSGLSIIQISYDPHVRKQKGPMILLLENRLEGSNVAPCPRGDETAGMDVMKRPESHIHSKAKLFKKSKWLLATNSRRRGGIGRTDSRSKAACERMGLLSSPSSWRKTQYDGGRVGG